MQTSRLALRYPREMRREITRAEVGKYWTEEGSGNPTPINLLGLYNRIVIPALVGKNPRAMLSTFKSADKPTVSAEQDWLNPEIEKMRLATSLQRCVQDALIYNGIMKVALATPMDAAMSGWSREAGQPFAEPIDLDDFVSDNHARDISRAAFQGHRYRAPLEAVKKFKVFSRDRLKLPVSNDEYINEVGDERISTLGRTYLSADSGEFEDMVDLWEVYLPRHRLVVTLADDHLTGAYKGKPLRVQRWLGPDCGPYHFLTYGIVPGNWMGKGPKLDLFDMHLFLNRTYRKLMRQADNFKNVGMVRSVASEDGKRVLDANDGDLIDVDDPSSLAAYNNEGPNPNLFNIFETGAQRFSWLAGNLDMLGGLSPQSKTATQDELLAKNASAAMADMQAATMDFTVSVLKGLLWFHHHHPTQIMQARHTVPGSGGLSINRRVTPQQRQQVPFAELDLRVDPYSLVYQTPQARLQTMMQTIQQVYIPLATLGQQQGISLDLNKMFQKVGQYSDDADLPELLTTAAPPMEGQSGGQSGAAPGPQNTTRSYERISRPGRTDQAYENVQKMQGNNLGGSQVRVPA